MTQELIIAASLLDSLCRQAGSCVHGKVSESHRDDAVARCVVDGDAGAAPGQGGHPGGLGEDSRTNLRSAPAMALSALDKDAALQTASAEQSPD